MTKNRIARLSAVFALLAVLLSPMFVSAAGLTQAGVRLGRLGISASAGNDLLVTTKLATAPTTVAKIRVTFPVGFTVATGTPAPGSTFPNTPASITAFPGTPTAAATAGSRTIVLSGITSASLTAGPLYGFTIPTGTVTNPGTAGSYLITVESLTSGDVLVDNATVSTYIYGAGANADQIAVTASVPASFSFSLSGNTDTIPQVDPSSTQTSTGVNLVISTNAVLGYTAYVKSANGQLMSASNPTTPIVNGTFNATPDTFVNGTTKYAFVPTTGAAATTFTGSITYDAEYAGLSATQGGAFNGTSFSSFVSRNGYTNADTFSLKERATVSSTIAPANDYADTLTIVAAGNF